jgi:hypothetical protein
VNALLLDFLAGLRTPSSAYATAHSAASP